MRGRKILMIFRLSLFLLFGLFLSLNAQTKSRIVGSVLDKETGEPLFGANVVVKGTYLGAATDIEGNFYIINVPVGTHEVQASIIGYQTQVMTGVLVSADRVTSLDFTLSQSAIQSEEVVVTAQRDALHKEVTNTQMVATDTQLKNSSGIREINAFLQKLPGVSQENGHLTIRGGSADQVGSMVNGLSYNNAAVGNSETTIPLSAIEQVSLMSGGYNAEYGNFRSGLINITTKSGTKEGYHGTINISRNNSHMKRFGPSFYDPNGPILSSYLDPDIAFVGTLEAYADDPYAQEQYPRFSGWNLESERYNRGKAPEAQATPLDMYLAAAWMFMSEPDYEGLSAMGYEVSDEHKRLFAEHKQVEEGYDVNFDAGFGGPIPVIGEYLGDATFYLSNKSTETRYTHPVSTDSEKMYTTFLTLESHPSSKISLKVNGLLKRQMGASAIRPPSGDAPNSSDRGGFMPTDNARYFSDDIIYFYDAAYFPLIEQTTFMGGITLNHVLSNSTFYELTVSTLSIKNRSNIGDNRDTTKITNFGPFNVDEMPYGKWQFAPNHKVDGFTWPSYDAVPGLSDYRFRGKEGDLYDNSKTNQYRIKFDITSQLDKHHYLKGGIEYNLIDIQHFFWEKWNNNAYNTYEFNYHRKPSQTGIYLQDQISYEGIVANLGIRADYYYSGGGLWPSGDPFAADVFRPISVDTSLYSYLESGRSYIWDQWVEYDKENPGFLEPIKNWLTFSPRIGVSFLVTEDSKFYFNYGHFRSNPPYYSMFLFKYRYDKNGLYEMSNPNLEPPKTISYELGMAINFFDHYIMQISGYYKDVSGQHGRIDYQNAPGTVNYRSLTNNEYVDIQGLEINIAKNDNSWITGWANFNYMLKKSGLTGRQIVTDITINSDQEGLYQGNEDRFLPSPQLNANISLHSPSEWGPEILSIYPLGGWHLTFFAEWKSGDYFTWNPLSKLHLSNNLQYPDYYMVDMKLSKSFNIAGFNTTFFLDVSNLFNLEVSLLSKEYAFQTDVDYDKYMASLKLPMYNSPEYDQLRSANPGFYEGGNDKVGDLRSDEKPYINDPNLPFWLYGYPRDVWFGLRIDF
ncbi:MAG: TonB-dependent receptor [Bacteroidetes bacterium]|nr:TonB-dependent receptor [Bacteroidota bacterium]